MKKTRTLILILMSIMLASCTDNLLVKAVPTPEGRRTVDSVYESIVGVTEIDIIEERPFLEFVTESTLGKRPDTGTEEEQKKWDDDSAVFQDIVLGVFGKEIESKVLPGVSLTFLEGFNIGDFDRLASLHTKADIAYMNERLGVICEEGKDYTRVLTQYYDFLTDMMNGSEIKGVVSLGNRHEVELRIADVVTVRLATRFLFNTLVEAVWSDWEQSKMAVDEYIKTLSTETIVYILTQKNMFEDILNTYTILNKLKGSTTIVDIGFLEGGTV